MVIKSSCTYVFQTHYTTTAENVFPSTMISAPFLDFPTQHTQNPIKKPYSKSSNPSPTNSRTLFPQYLPIYTIAHIWTFCQLQFRSASTETIFTKFEAILASHTDHVGCFTDASVSTHYSSAVDLTDSDLSTFALPTSRA